MECIFAVPIVDGLLSAHFGHCSHFAIIQVKDNKIVKQENVVPPPHEPGVLPKWLAEKGVNEILAGGIGQSAVNLFSAQNIKVHMGADKKTPEELVNDWLTNKLQTGSNTCSH